MSVCPPTTFGGIRLHMASCLLVVGMSACNGQRADVAGPSVDTSDPAQFVATQQARDRYMALRKGYPATLNSADKYGYTLLHHCAKHGYADFAREILDNPDRMIGVDAKDNIFGHTPFLLCIVHGRLEMAKMFQAAGADVNAKRGDGQNAAILAVRNNRPHLIPYLRQIGVNFSVRDEDGKDALDYAKEMKKESLLTPRQGEDVRLDALGDTPQVAAVRAMRAVLAKGDYAGFYRDWCHPHIAAQVTAEEFVGHMKSDKGREIIRLYAEVLKHVDAKVGPEALIARPEEKEGQYEFILVSVKALSRGKRATQQWHLELGLHDGKWKLMDTD